MEVAPWCGLSERGTGPRGQVADTQPWAGRDSAAWEPRSGAQGGNSEPVN